MRARRAIVAGRDEPLVAVHDRRSGRWVALGAVLDDAASPQLRAAAGDMLALLAGGRPLCEEAEALAARRADSAPEIAAGSLLPFEPRSLRAFSVYPAHVEQSGRMLAKRFFPRPAGAAIGAFEAVTRRTFPMLRPRGSFMAEPAMYVGNHTRVLADGDTLPWPSHTDWLDLELELGFVLAHEVEDATPEEGAAAIGGFFVVNDWSARDVQADEYRHGSFGPAVKAKSFNNSIGPEVVSAGDLLGRVSSLSGRITVNGELWSETSTAGAAHAPGDLVAFASRGERLGPGDVFMGGTLPRGCGLELDRWLEPGDTVELEIEELGTLRNVVGPKPT